MAGIPYNCFKLFGIEASEFPTFSASTIQCLGLLWLGERLTVIFGLDFISYF